MKLDELRMEMMNRGCTEIQVNSKAVAIALDVFSESGDKYTCL